MQKFCLWVWLSTEIYLQWSKWLVSPILIIPTYINQFCWKKGLHKPKDFKFLTIYYFYILLPILKYIQYVDFTENHVSFLVLFVYYFADCPNWGNKSKNFPDKFVTKKKNWKIHYRKLIPSGKISEKLKNLEVNWN